MRTNSLKRAHGDRTDYALQITEAARSAGLVRGDGETEHLAECYVAAVHGLLVVVDVEVAGASEQNSSTPRATACTASSARRSSRVGTATRSGCRTRATRASSSATVRRWPSATSCS